MLLNDSADVINSETRILNSFGLAGALGPTNDQTPVVLLPTKYPSSILILFPVHSHVAVSNITMAPHKFAVHIIEHKYLQQGDNENEAIKNRQRLGATPNKKE